MTDKKKPFDLETASLEKLTGLSSMAELREQMNALTRPSYLTDLQAQMERLTQSSYLTDFQAQMEALTRPSYLTDLQAQMERLTQSSYLTDFQAQMEKLSQPSYLTDFQAQMEKLSQPSYLTDFQAQMEKLSQPSYLTDFQTRMEKLSQPSYLADLQAKMAELTRPSSLEELQNRLSSLTGGTWIQTELAEVAGSYQGLLRGSVLASFLARPESFGESDANVQRVARYDSLDVSDFADLEIDTVRSVDLQIVQAISQGDVAKLPPTAMQRLHSVYVQVLVYWDMLLRIFNTYMAYAFLTALMSGASAPAEVHERAALLSNEQRVLLADVRMVNREGANLRAEPTTQSKSIASLPFAHPVEVLEYNDKGWYRVEAETPDGYLEGWMYVSVTTPVPKPKRLRGQKVDAETL